MHTHNMLIVYYTSGRSTLLVSYLSKSGNTALQKYPVTNKSPMFKILSKSTSINSKRYLKF